MTERALPSWIVDHLRQYQESPDQAHLHDMTFAGGLPDTPTLLLTTIGRKSGKPLTLPLIYGKDGDRYVIIASKGGAPENPAWYLNLTAQPLVEVQVAADKFRAVGRTVGGEERQRLWKMMSDVYPPYPSYQKRTAREIPVVVLTRAAGK